MRAISLKVHYVEDTKVTFHIAADDIRLLYRTAGIDLQFLSGAGVAVDPALSSLTTYDDLVKQYRASDQASGHLIVGKSPLDQRPEIAGQLVDLDARGVAAVYTRSDYIQRDPVNNFLQTCAHEIGHMLNLGHQDVVPEYDSAMCQVGNRLKEAPECWAGAQKEAERVASSGKPDFFARPPKQLTCLPLAYAARQRLNTSSDDRLRPWGSKFERLFAGTNDCICARRPTRRDR